MRAQHTSILRCFVVVLLVLGIAHAQQPKFKPDQTIKATFTFEGVDASKISQIRMIWSLEGPRHDNQPSFMTNIDATGSGPAEVSYTVPKGQASGDYVLSQVIAIVSSLGNISVNYDSQEIPKRRLTIDNSNTFDKPKIKDITVSGP